MKVAFTAQGKSWKDLIDIRFGRAKGFFIVDTDTGQTSFINNMENAEAAHGAGTSAAQSLASAGIQELVTGQVGPKTASVLKAEGIRVLGGIGYTSIEEVYERFRRGSLIEQNIR